MFTVRQMLRKLLRGKLEFTPVEIEGQRGYRFVGIGTYERLPSGEALDVLARTVVAPNGISPPGVFPPVQFHGIARDGPA
jgi:hypothetical protein